MPNKVYKKITQVEACQIESEKDIPVGLEAKKGDWALKTVGDNELYIVSNQYFKQNYKEVK